MSILLSKTVQLIFYAFLGGILPSLLWLWFWLKEDCHPESKKAIFKTFMAGAAVIPLVFFVELAFSKLFTNSGIADSSDYPIILILALAATEEYFKYFAAKYTALNKKYFDEPIDGLIYLITAALGFAAMENFIYIFQAFLNKGVLPGFLSGNLRFLGASLIHVVSSGFLGASIAFSFFHKENLKRNLFIGFIIATLLHSLFNYFIIKSANNIFEVFLGVWVFAIIIIYILEKLKDNKK